MAALHPRQKYVPPSVTRYLIRHEPWLTEYAAQELYEGYLLGIWQALELEPDKLPRKYPTLTELAARAMKRYMVGEKDFFSPRRNAAYALARHYFYWLAKVHTIKSYPEIGRFIGRDHATVLHGARKYQAMLERGEVQP